MKKLFFLVIAASLLTSCSSAEKKAVENQPGNSAPAAVQNAQPAAAMDDAALAKLLVVEDLNEPAPKLFYVDVKTTKGTFRIEVNHSWAHKGVDRFYNLVKAGYFTDIAFFRMVEGFVIQFGIHGSPLVNDVWREARIQDDVGVESNVRGTLTFATSGRNSRTTQLFINIADNPRLDSMGFAPIGKIVSGMEVVDSLNFEYGERPDQGRIHKEGNKYLREKFPNLDYIESMTIVDAPKAE